MGRKINKNLHDDATSSSPTTLYDLRSRRNLLQALLWIKGGSSDLTFHQMIHEACKTSLPIFLATGASDLFEQVVSANYSFLWRSLLSFSV